MADNLQKRPSKGILKNSSSFDKQDSRSAAQAKKNKETKWDEMNIIATLHPPDKDYGHMKIEEPKTPYNYDDLDADSADVLDATELAEKIRLGTERPPKVLRSESEDDDNNDDEDLTPEARAKKREFENKRKKHYNEFYAVKLARKLLEEDEDEDKEDEDMNSSNISSKSSIHKSGCSKDLSE